MITKDQISEFLRKNYRRIPAVEFMYGVDNNQNPASVFETAGLRVLVSFLSTGPVRAVSSTYTVVENLVKLNQGNK